MPSYFEDFGKHHEFTCEMVQVALAVPLSVDDVLNGSLESLREALAETIVSGRPLLINIGMLGPDFNNCYTHRTIFPSQKIFNWHQLQRSGIY